MKAAVGAATLGCVAGTVVLFAAAQPIAACVALLGAFGGCAYYESRWPAGAVVETPGRPVDGDPLAPSEDNAWRALAAQFNRTVR